MLRKLTIKKFQNHRKTILTFPSDSRIIAIIGPSDCGKTALMRSLQYLFLLGKGYPTTGESDCEVRAEFDDFWIERNSSFKLDGAKNVDEIRTGGSVSAFWNKFHRQLPDGVSDVTHIANLDIEDLDTNTCLNFLGQMDQPLSLAMRPSQISKIFGSVSGRNKIDSALRVTNTLQKRNQRDVVTFEEQIKATEAEVEKLVSSLPSVKPDVIEIQKLHSVYQDLLSSSLELDEIDSCLSDIRAKVDLAAQALELVDLEELDGEMRALREAIVFSGEIPDIVPIDLEAIDAAIDLDNLAEQLEELNELCSAEIACRDTELEVTFANGLVEVTSKELTNTRKQLETLLQKEGTCPYSGEKLPSGCAKSLAS